MFHPTTLLPLEDLVKISFGNVTAPQSRKDSYYRQFYQLTTYDSLETITLISSSYCRQRHSRVWSFRGINLPSCFRANITFRLRGELLPSLRDAIDTLCDELESDISEAPVDVLDFEEMAEKLLEIKKILTQVYSCTNSLDDLVVDGKFSPEPLHNPIEKSALKEPLDSYPFHRIMFSLLNLAEHCKSTFELVQESFSEMTTLSDLEDTIECDDDVDRTLIEFIRTISSKAEVIQVLSRPDFDHFQEYCQRFNRLNIGSMSHMYELITKDYEYCQDSNFGVRLDNNTCRIHSFIPILKLTRIFLNKTSKRVNSELQIVSKMTISQQSEINKGLGRITTALKEFVECEAWLDLDDNPLWMPTFLLKTLSTFNEPLKTLNEHFNSCTDKTPLKDVVENRRAQDWCLMWTEQLDLAIKSFCIAFKEKFR